MCGFLYLDPAALDSLAEISWSDSSGKALLDASASTEDFKAVVRSCIWVSRVRFANPTDGGLFLLDQDGN
jgi:hypothetical protein